jgi:hypothetical protein
MDTFCVSASTLSRVSALSHETLPVTRIYHNSAYTPEGRIFLHQLLSHWVS